MCQKKKKKIALSRPGPPRSGQPPWPVSRVGQNLVFSCLRSVRFACASEISLLILLSERRLLYAVCLFASCGLTPFSSLPIESSGLSLSLSLTLHNSATYFLNNGLFHKTLRVCNDIEQSSNDKVKSNRRST